MVFKSIYTIIVICSSPQHYYISRRHPHLCYLTVYEVLRCKTVWEEVPNNKTWQPIATTLGEPEDLSAWPFFPNVTMKFVKFEWDLSYLKGNLSCISKYWSWSLYFRTICRMFVKLYCSRNIRCEPVRLISHTGIVQKSTQLKSVVLCANFW